jgi:hypothetical protein
MNKEIEVTIEKQKIELTREDLIILRDNKELNIPLEINIKLKYLK